MKKLAYLKTFVSPFKRLKLKWYVGKIAVGTPYFYPRNWIDDPDKPGYMKAVPKKIGFDFVGLGWKTKWSNTDYRYEWSPIWSFIFWKWQIAVIFDAPVSMHYWEAWLYYENNTDKTSSMQDRIQQCKDKFPQTYKVYINGEESSIDYYKLILKDKYK